MNESTRLGVLVSTLISNFKDEIQQKFGTMNNRQRRTV